MFRELKAHIYRIPLIMFSSHWREETASEIVCATIANLFKYQVVKKLKSV